MANFTVIAGDFRCHRHYEMVFLARALNIAKENYLIPLVIDAIQSI